MRRFSGRASRPQLHGWRRIGKEAMKTAVIIPPLVSRQNSVSSGIFFMPFTMAHLAGALRGAGHGVSVHDMFGLAPHRASLAPPNVYLGINPGELVTRLSPDTEAAFIYAWGVASFKAIEGILRELKTKLPNVPAIVVENAHAVTSMSLATLADQLLAMGAEYVILGESEERALKILDHLAGRGPLPDDGLARMVNGQPVTLKVTTYIENLDTLPFPAWDLFPVEAYWNLGYAHGPQEEKYLALLTSRGCPFGCRFCVLPSTSNRTWRARTPENVFEEMRHWYQTMGVREFHIEDVNPTTDRRRLAKLGRIIREAKMPFVWKFASGTKIETITVETLRDMAEGGCRYVSFSPESGSKRVMKLIGKPFDYDHGLKMTREMRRLGVTSQAVFLLGFPGEEDEDRRLSLAYLSKLVRAGLDEVLVLITTPIPGSAIFEQFSGYGDYSELTFTPTYRSDYASLLRWQRQMYLRFFALKLLCQPVRCAQHVLSALRRRFKTKMEMTLWRFLIVQRDISRGRRRGAGDNGDGSCTVSQRVSGP